MSWTEWMIASHVTRSACGSRSDPRLRRERGVLDPGVGEVLDHPSVELRVGRVVHDGAAVLALEVDRVDAAELLQLREDRVRPVRTGVELEAKFRVAREKGLDPCRRRRISEPAGGDEPDRSRVTSDDVAEGAARLTEREVEGGTLERPAPVVDVRVHLGRSLEERQRVEVAREAVDGPLAGEGQHGPARLLGVLLAPVIGHVLAEPFLAGADEADLGRLARELGRDDVRVTLQVVPVDRERERADRVVEAHRPA